jgi:acyl-[acyl-carrier-protein]-phospholipid O-acyltransferase/long-chain-fatty-acid--[acyl-carrier-protein] ligase
MQWLLKIFAKLIFKLAYRVEVRGLENYQYATKNKQPILIIANHVSLLDGPLLELFVPGETTFMVDKSHTEKWYERFLLSMTNFISVDIHSPYAAKHMVDELKKGKQCMVFPEGRITTNGALMKVYDGTGLIADKADAQVLTINIEGAVYSNFSYLNGNHFSYIKQRWFPKIRLTIRPPVTVSADKSLKGTERHKFYKQQVFKLLRDAQYYGSVQDYPVFKSLLEAKKKYNAKQINIEDINHVNLSLKKLVVAAKVLGAALTKQLGDQQRVAIMLPNVSAMPVTFFALQAYGYVPAMINFTAGQGAIKSALETAELQTLITSRKFVEAFEIEDLIAVIAENTDVIYLEDIKEQIGVFDKITGLLRSNKSMPGYSKQPEDEAVVLFTSGSEGAPKGVVLTHSNLLSNINQINAMLHLLPNERVFNALPTFHSFGLTAGLLWPILKGAKVFLYPSPVHYSVVPEMVYSTNAKLVFGTDTFFNGYARKADSFDFYSLRALVAGAERLRPETRTLYANKFRQPIYEGYGVTETTPVLAVNIPTAFKDGSVGQFVPGVEYRLENVPGIDTGGRLFVKGPNIMKGYLMPDQSGVLLPPPDGWHDTGDIVDVDEDGYIWIKGRAKRFAKIGGEIVSLTSVESYINQASPESHHVVVAVPDERKGEQLVLVTDDAVINRKAIAEAAKEKEVSELMIPKTVILVEKVPVLGTGKTNYPEVQKIAERYFNS